MLPFWKISPLILIFGFVKCQLSRPPFIPPAPFFFIFWSTIDLFVCYNTKVQSTTFSSSHLRPHPFIYALNSLLLISHSLFIFIISLFLLNSKPHIHGHGQLLRLPSRLDPSPPLPYAHGLRRPPRTDPKSAAAGHFTSLFSLVQSFFHSLLC